MISIFFERKYFTEIFLGIYLWLGYWWKFSYLQFINVSEKISLSSSEGFVPQFISKNILNETFYSLIIVYIALFLSFKIFKFFYNDYFNDIYDQENYFSNLYKKYKLLIIFSYLILVIFISISNIYFGIYQKGLLISKEINPYIINLYKWLILFGLSFIGSIILFYETRIKSRNLIWTITLVLFENFLVATSNLSRAMIVNSSSILLGTYKSINFLNTQKKNFLTIKFVIIMIIFFVLSLLGSIELRKISFKINLEITEQKIITENKTVNLKTDKELVSNEETKEKIDINEENNFDINFQKYLGEFIYLITKRWVGIESMILVTQNKERDFNTFLDAFKDRFSKNTQPYYERNFVIKNLENNDSSNAIKNHNTYNDSGQYIYGVITPGFVSFFHYTNNIFFLFFSMFIIGILFLYFEKFISYMSGNNLILISFLTHLSVYRLIHFGYLPHQTYLLFGTIILNLLFLYFVKKFYYKFKHK